MKKDREVEYKGFTISVYQHPTATSPREKDDNVIEFVCRNCGREIGDKSEVKRAIDYLYDNFALRSQVLDWFMESRNVKLYKGEEVTAEITPYHETCDRCYVWEEKGEQRSLAFNSLAGSFNALEGISAELAYWEKFAIAAKNKELAVKLISESTTEDGRVLLFLEEDEIGPRWERDCIGFAWVSLNKMEEGLCKSLGEDWKEKAFERMADEMNLYETWLNGGICECEILGEDIYGKGVDFAREELCDERDIEEAIKDAKEAIDCHLSCIKGTAEMRRKDNLNVIRNHIFLPKCPVGVYGVAFTDRKQVCMLSPQAAYGKVNISIAKIGENGELSQFKRGRLEELSDIMLNNIVQYYKNEI